MYFRGAKPNKIFCINVTRAECDREQRPVIIGQQVGSQNRPEFDSCPDFCPAGWRNFCPDSGTHRGPIFFFCPDYDSNLIFSQKKHRIRSEKAKISSITPVNIHFPPFVRTLLQTFSNARLICPDFGGDIQRLFLIFCPDYGADLPTYYHCACSFQF